uniref:Kinesin motor domain-containing protein n=1 Tax=Panagrellus redivivus TaxID=6233 RepID=A0A7E4ZSG9_PANRE
MVANEASTDCDDAATDTDKTGKEFVGRGCTRTGGSKEAVVSRLTLTEIIIIIGTATPEDIGGLETTRGVSKRFHPSSSRLSRTHALRQYQSTLNPIAQHYSKVNPVCIALRKQNPCIIACK